MADRSLIRFPAIGLALVALALGLWAGLDLIGWSLFVPTPALPGSHGVLMVNGVLASLIGIERAVALGRRAFYLAPLLTAIGGISLVVSGNPLLAFPLVTIGTLVLLAAFAVILKRQPALFTAVQFLGALALLGGNLLGGYGLGIPYLIPWWASFLVLLTAAERLELTRLRRLSALDRLTFVIPVLLAVVGCVQSIFAFASGFFIAASGWLLLGVWLLFHDIAYRNLSRPGLPRFTAVCLLSGYVWLVLGGAIVWTNGGWLVGLSYDAGLHALFLGFVLSMVFAHAPIILPAVLGKPFPFARPLYVPVAILHASLAVRVGADLLGLQILREWGGLFNVVAIVLFGLLLLASYLHDSSPLRTAYRTDASGFYP